LCVRRIVPLLLVLVASLAPPQLAAPSAVVAYFWERLTIANNSSAPYPLDEVLLPLPLNDSYQSSHLLNFSVEIDGTGVEGCQAHVVERECGSSYLAVRCPRSIPPFATLSIEVVARVLTMRFRPPSLNYSSSGLVGDVPPSLLAYARPEGPWRYDEEGMRYLAEKARELAGGEDRVLAVVAKLVKWIWGKVDYDIGVGPRYPNETLPPTAVEEGRGRGDCDDQANLLILMLRSLGIPAYLKIALVADFNYGEERRLWEPGMHYYVNFLGVNWGHAWAEVYVPPWGWLPVDLAFHLPSNDPLEAIRSSAASEYWARYTVVTIRLRNVCHSDYIAEFRRELREAVSSPLFYYWEYAVVREGDSLARVKGFLKPLPLPWVKQTELEVQCPSKVKVFSQFKVRGVLRPGVANAQLLVELQSPSGESYRRVVVTKEDGSWVLTLRLNETGLWTLTIVYNGSARYSPSSTRLTLLVEKLASKLNLRASAEAGVIEVWGELRPHLSNATVEVVIRAPNGTLLRATPRLREGEFNVTFRVSVPGEYEVAASWLGNEYYRHAYNATLVRVVLPTRIEIEESESVFEGELFKLRGVLEPGLVNASLYVIAESAEGTRLLKVVKTSDRGRFSVGLELGAGEWRITVSFNGSDYYLPSSKTLEVRIKQRQDLIPYAAIAIAAVAIAVIVMRKRGA